MNSLAPAEKRINRTAPMFQDRRPNILVVDDEKNIREFLSILLRKHGLEVMAVDGVHAAISAFDAGAFDLVISDLRLPDGDGLTILRHVKECDPESVFIMITAHGTTQTAVEAMKAGAFDYLTKPFEVDDVRLNIQRALEKKYLEEENRFLRQELDQRFGLIGSSPQMKKIYELIARVKDTPTTILITGESGTGKEIVARAVHYSSKRAIARFVPINCGAIPENLVESELFGYRRGAFTGALHDKRGLFEVAHRGTLFLDEIAELSQALQVKLLRVIQEKKIMAVGGTDERAIDLRLIAATNRVLADEMKAGRFREDLYYRLNVVQIELPPLRDRPDDIPLLVHHFIKKWSKEMEKLIEGIDADALRLLQAYDFPGNVRELENMIERAVALEGSRRMTVASLPELTNRREPIRPPLMGVDQPLPGASLDDVVARLEIGMIRQALEKSGGVKTEAAKLLGISFRSFRYRLAKYGLESEGTDETGQ